MKKLASISGVLFFLPFLAFAQSSYVNYLGNLAGQVGSILSALIPILVTAAIVVFFFGLIQYILSNSEAKKKDGKSMMIGGIIAIFIMVSLWGIITILQSVTLSGTNAQHPQAAPTVPNVP